MTNFSILRPDGSIFEQWDFDLASQNLPSPFYSGTAFDWQYALPADAPAGVWQFTAVFEGQTYVRTFAVSRVDLGAAGRAREQVGIDTTRCRPAIGKSPAGCP
ncbi:MAG: hypothetical protein JSS13_06585 [Proteobacteria bacterium]|nr:hypothetical protein [Pseudomonadota bacterium]